MHISLVYEYNLYGVVGEVITPLATAWLELITSSYSLRSSCSIAKGIKGRKC